MTKREIVIGLLILVVTVGATMSYCSGEPGWRRPPAPSQAP